MRKQLLVVLLASTVFSGCAAQSYSVAGSGVYVGSGSYPSSNLSIGVGYSSGPGWYGYPWYSSAYLHPVYPGYWPGYVSIGYGPGGFYGGFNLGWGYYNPSAYYSYSGYSGYSPYYGHGYRGHYRRGPYRHPAYSPGYAHSPYRPYYRGNHGGEYYGNGHEYDRRGSGGSEHQPRESVKQPVRVVRMPAYTSEARYSGNRPTHRADDVRSRSGNSGWKGDQPPSQQLHRNSDKQVRPVKPQPVKVVRRETRVVERDAGYTPPRSSSAQRSASGRSHYKGNQPPPQQLHSGDRGKVSKSVQTAPGRVGWSPAQQKVSYGQAQQPTPGQGAPRQQMQPQPRQQVRPAAVKTEQKQHKSESKNGRSNKNKQENRHR